MLLFIFVKQSNPSENISEFNIVKYKKKDFQELLLIC
jgi:hypothetical protein